MKLTDAVDLSRDEWNNLIDQYIFVDEHRKILKRRLLDGLTYNQLAEEFNFSVPQAVMNELMDDLMIGNKRVYDRVMDKLRRV